MQLPFDTDSPYRGHLTDLVSRAVDIDVRLRALQAERATLFAEAFALADLEGERPPTGPGDLSGAADRTVPATRADSPGLGARLPRGMTARLERAHRVIRAELASALNISAWTIASDISHAVDTLTRFPVLHAAQARGEITEKHVRSVIDAGRIIGHLATEQTGSTLVDAAGVLLEPDAAAAEIARRYARFDADLLPHAQSLTPALLIPVAKRLAEKLAGASFDDRHRIARRARQVSLTELEDGMCQLTALVTSLEGHAVFDRLTQYGKLLQTSDLAASTADTPASSPGSSMGIGTGTGTGTSGSGSDADIDTRVQSVVGAATAALKRPLGEARADSLVSLLLEGELADPAHRFAHDLSGSTKKKLGPRVTARVQVLVPVSLTGRLDTPRPVDTDTADFGSPGSPGTVSTSTPGTVSTGTPAPKTPPRVEDGAFQPELVGVGPIDTDTAARIMHDTPTWDMIVITDGTTQLPNCPNCTSTRFGVGSDLDTTGDILTVDGYRVPAHLRRLLAARDQHCRFPGCTLPVYRCDIDHTIAAEGGGPTASTNLGYLCRGHHTLKHHGGFVPTQNGQGEFTWTLPSGRTYVTTPPSKVTFRTAITQPDLRTRLANILKQHPYGITDWDSDSPPGESPPGESPPGESPHRDDGQTSDVHRKPPRPDTWSSSPPPF